MMPSVGQHPLLVYCAASVEPAVAAIAAAYQRETGTAITLEAGPSGPLVEKLKRARQGDLYIPAAQSPYLDDCEQDGTVTRIVRLAALRLVLGVNRATPAAVTLQDLLAGKRRYSIAHEEAAAGLATLEAIAPLGSWQEFAKGATIILPNVSEVAAAIRDGAAVDCGIVWDATARQYGLSIVELAELSSARAVIAAGVLATSRDTAAAGKFADYLAAPDKGGVLFKTLGYSASGS